MHLLITFLVSGLLFIGMVAIAPAQSVPQLINYQGRLANPDGSPFPTADYELSVRIYDEATTNAVLVWGPQIFDGSLGTAGHGAKVPVVQGYFNVVLGPTDTNGTSLASAFRGSNCFVEVTVSNRPPILPRQQILTTPYAFRAGDVADGVITSRKLAPRPTGTDVPPGGVAIGSTVSHTSTATALTIVPGIDVRIETQGRPVKVFLTAGAGGAAFIEAYSEAGMAQAVFELWRDGNTAVGAYILESSNAGAVGQGSAVPSSSVQFIDTPPAGIHSYTIKMIMRLGNRDVRIVNSRLVAYEL